jgi:hypothetical protein
MTRGFIEGGDLHIEACKLRLFHYQRGRLSIFGNYRVTVSDLCLHNSHLNPDDKNAVKNVEQP